MDDPIDVETLFWPEESGSPNLPSPWENPTHMSLCKSSTNYVPPKHSFGCTKQAQAWFDVRVFYVRVGSCLPDEAPDSLLVVYPQRDISTELEVNGGRISPSERACFTMRRDRVDTGAAEATYVSTNNLRTTGDLPFEIYDKDELIVHGTLARTGSPTDDNMLIEGYICVASSPMSNDAGWRMDCTCGISSYSCSFLKGKMDFSTVNPTMEVYVAGRSCGLPLVLTTTVQLSVRRKSLRYCTLDVIPEFEESQPNQVVAGQIADDEAYTKMPNHPPTMGLSSSFYMPLGGEYVGEGDDGELSWFNAGVRVGVGIGLGLCLGVGIGVGLLVRPFKRRLL